MLIAETEYKLRVEDDIRPFRDVLLGMFFISVGMQLDGGLVLQQLGWVILTVVLLIGASHGFATVGKVVRPETADANIAAALIAPGGEFGFVLLTLGLSPAPLPSQGSAGGDRRDTHPHCWRRFARVSLNGSTNALPRVTFWRGLPIFSDRV